MAYICILFSRLVSLVHSYSNPRIICEFLTPDRAGSGRVGVGYKIYESCKDCYICKSGYIGIILSKLSGTIALHSENYYSDAKVNDIICQ